MRNIIELSSDNLFPRIRVGIGRPPEGWDLKDWVLSGYFTKEDRETIFNTFMLARDAALEFASDGVDAVRLFLSRSRANKLNN